MDQQTTNDGKPFAPIRYQQIIEECVIISEHLHTSYLDVLNVSPRERAAMIGYLVKEAQKRNEIMQKHQAELEAKRKQR